MDRLLQTTDHVLMVRPVHFAYNPQTAGNNAFQKEPSLLEGVVHQKALTEFDAFVTKLRAHKIEVIVVQDTPEPHTPDSIFPNNGFSLHHDGTLVLYPMFALNRRLERKPELRTALEGNFAINRIIDLTHYEIDEKFLEGTGSMVLDHENRIVYACQSIRTHGEVLLDFCRQLDYSPILFNALDRKGQPIYHTNVMMCVTASYMVVCLDTIPDKADQKRILASAAATDKEVILLEISQMEQFAGNMLQLHNTQGQPTLVLSTSAFGCLLPCQRERLMYHNPLLTPNIPTIEEHGGGSVRCMMAECFAPKRKITCQIGLTSLA